MADLLEERYRQLETNFNAIVAELKGRTASPQQSAELEALLSKKDLDLRHALLRAQAANLEEDERLEERRAILQLHFARLVDLLNEPAAASPTSLPRGGSPSLARSSTPLCVAPPGNKTMSAELHTTKLFHPSAW